jgi:hypothetical protein
MKDGDGIEERGEIIRGEKGERQGEGNCEYHSHLWKSFHPLILQHLAARKLSTG